MSQRARLVMVILTVGVVAACSSDSSTEEIEELREEVVSLSEQLDQRDERLDDLEEGLAALEAAPPPAPTTGPTDLTTTSLPEPDGSDVEAILPLRSDLPDGWDEDPFVTDLGLGDGADFLLVGPCSPGPTGDLDDPVVIAETGFVRGGATGPAIATAVVRFDDPGLDRVVQRLVADSADCDVSFEDEDGRFTTSALDLDVDVDGADVVATLISAEVEASSFAVGGVGHDVIARVGPYVLVVSHFAPDATPDLAITTALVELMVERAQELVAG